MKELKNLTDIGNLLASHPIYTYDYTDGLYINPCYKGIQVYSIDLGNEEEDHLTPDLIKSLYISKLFQSLKY